MNRYWPYLGVLIVVVLTIASGVIQGHFSRRWGPPADLLAMAERFNELPVDVGPWRFRQAIDFPETTQKTLECKGYINRTYQHSTTGRQINVAVILGPPGPISVHTPEVCFSSRDYEQEGESRKITIPVDGVDQELWMVTFEPKSKVTADRQVAYWGWSTGGPWAAAKNARFKYAGQPYLFKIQLAGTLPPLIEEQPKIDACQEFLADFLPALNRVIRQETD